MSKKAPAVPEAQQRPNIEISNNTLSFSGADKEKAEAVIALANAAKANAEAIIAAAAVFSGSSHNYGIHIIGK